MFDRYFASQQIRPRRPALLAVSIGLHALIALAIVGWSWAHVARRAAADVPLTFFAPPSAGPSPVAAAARPPSRPTRVARSSRLVRRTRAASTPAPSEVPAEQPGPSAPSGATDGVPGGVAGGGGVRVVPQFLFDTQRLSAPDPHLPDWFAQQHPRQVVTGLYRICVDRSGRVADVQVVSGIPGVDAVIVAQIRSTWTYRPQPMPVCSPRLFKFQIN